MGKKCKHVSKNSIADPDQVGSGQKRPYPDPSLRRRRTRSSRTTRMRRIRRTRTRRTTRTKMRSRRTNEEDENTEKGDGNE